ncbi:MAG: hypothetical protein WD906_02400 [Anaerolineales bacterium]
MNTSISSTVVRPGGRRRWTRAHILLVAAAVACVCPGIPGQDPNSIATSVAATLTAAAPRVVPSAPSSPTPQTGILTGQVCYPSESIPPMTAYFEDTLTHAVTSLAIAQDQGSYSVDLPAGTYHAYAWVAEFGIGGSYSQMVPCGLTAACTDHSLIAVNVAAGSITGGADICDWYGGPDSVPTPPGAPAPPPPGGVSLNCDDTYQRVRLTDAGVAGRTLWVDSWDGGAWVNVWSVAGGDPNIRQIEEEAGAYQFLGCPTLVVLPIRYSGSGAYLELSVQQWNGAGLTQVYQHEGTHGVWSKAGATIQFDESLYLYNEPTCCPCNHQTLRHTWNGAAFVEEAPTITPTFTGTPPAECSS